MYCERQDNELQQKARGRMPVLFPSNVDSKPRPVYNSGTVQFNSWPDPRSPSGRGARKLASATAAAVLLMGMSAQVKSRLFSGLPELTQLVAAGPMHTISLRGCGLVSVCCSVGYLGRSPGQSSRSGLGFGGSGVSFRVFERAHLLSDGGYGGLSSLNKDCGDGMELTGYRVTIRDG